MYIGKGKVMVHSEYKIILNERAIECFADLKYLGSVKSKDGGREGEVEEIVKQGRKIAGVLKSISKNGSTVSVCVKVKAPCYVVWKLALLEGEKSRLRELEIG